MAQLSWIAMTSAERVSVKSAIGRLGCTSALIGLALAVSVPARADDIDFSGAWSISGHIVTGNLLTTVSPICAFRQTGDRLTGSCKGPNAAGAATGVAEGRNISFQWRHVAANAVGLSGVSTFRGALGPDNVVRGFWTISRLPNASGSFTAQRP
jgi:hypothetical protein